MFERVLADRAAGGDADAVCDVLLSCPSQIAAVYKLLVSRGERTEADALMTLLLGSGRTAVVSAVLSCGVAPATVARWVAVGETSVVATVSAGVIASEPLLWPTLWDSLCERQRLGVLASADSVCAEWFWWLAGVFPPNERPQDLQWLLADAERFEAGGLWEAAVSALDLLWMLRLMPGRDLVPAPALRQAVYRAAGCSPSYAEECSRLLAVVAASTPPDIVHQAAVMLGRRVADAATRESLWRLAGRERSSGRWVPNGMTLVRPRRSDYSGLPPADAARHWFWEAHTQARTNFDADLAFAALLRQVPAGELPAKLALALSSLSTVDECARALWLLPDDLVGRELLLALPLRCAALRFLWADPRFSDLFRTVVADRLGGAWMEFDALAAACELTLGEFLSTVEAARS